MNKLPFILCLTAVAYVRGPLQAQEQQISLDPVTTTSTISSVASSKTGRNIVVISGDRFKNLPVNSIDELLRYVPGVEVQSRGPMGAQSDIVIRGGTFQQVLVLLDGVRLNDPITGHFNSYIPLAPFEIERVEILKGAASAIYGSEAVGGVVHFITKTFAAQKGTSRKEAAAQLSAGQYDGINAQAGAYYSNGRSAVGGGLLTNNTTGVQQRGIRGYFNLHTASLSASHYFTPQLKASFRSAYDDRSFAAQNFYTTFASDTAIERVRSSWNHLNLTHKTEANKLSLDVGYKSADDHYAFNPVAIANDNKSKLAQLLLQNERKLHSNVVLNTGLQYLNRRIRSNDRGNHEESQAALFALLQYATPSGLNVLPSLRIDWNEQRGVELVPHLALSYKRSKIQFRASGGRTIRDADFTERYNNYNKARVTGGRIGNPALEAETAVAYEMGADYFSSTNLKISGTVFQRRHRKLIDYIPTAYINIPRRQNLVVTGSYALASNIARVNIQGAEVDMQYSYMLRPSHTLWGSLGVVVTGVSGAQDASAFYLTSFARFLTNFNVIYSTPHFVFSINGLYKQREPQSAAAISAKLSESYFVINARTEVTLVKNRLALFTQLDNVFDESYSDLLGARMPGRWFLGGAKISL